MDSLHVESDLLMRDRAEFAEVVLLGTKVGDQLDMTESKFTGHLNMERLQIGTDLFMRDMKVALGSKVNVGYAQIKGNMLIWHSNLPSLDLTGTKIGGELILGTPTFASVKWQRDALLTLHNTEVATFVDREHAWPDNLKLVGFTYARLPRGIAIRDVSLFNQEWLQSRRNIRHKHMSN